MLFFIKLKNILILGVYRTQKVQTYIDVNDVTELHRIQKEKNTLTLGANVTLSVAKTTFEKYANVSNFKYLKTLAEHIDQIATVPVRNVSNIKSINFFSQSSAKLFYK